MNIFSINLKFIPFIMGSTFALTLFGGITLADFLFPFCFLLFFFNTMIEKRGSLLVTSNHKIIMALFFFSYMFSLLASDLHANVGYSVIIKDQVKLLSVFVISALISSRMLQTRSFIRYFLISYCIANFFVIVFFSNMSIGDHNFWRHGIGESVSLGIAAALPYNKKTISIISLFALALVNIFMDFRGMALVLFLSCIFLNILYFPNSGSLKKIVAIMALLSIFVGGLCSFFLSQNLYANRRGQSNLVRSAMIITAVSDMFESGFLGHGSEYFKKKFKIPNIDNPNLQKNIDGTLPLHGYLFSASYDAGKLGIIFYIYLLALIFMHLFRMLRKIGSLHEFSTVIVLIYFVYSSFMQAFSGFDRILLGFSMGIILTGLESSSVCGAWHNKIEQ